MSTSILHRNNVRVFGRGTQPVMFAHGFGCDQNMWRFITPAFEEDYKIILFDYVGAGASDTSSYNHERYRDLNGYTQDILDICDALKLSDIIFVGHSVSSMVGVLASIKSPKYFKALILVAPSPCYINDGKYIGGFNRTDIEELLDTMDKNYVGWANFLGPAIMKNSDQPELTNELVESFCAIDPTIAREFAKATFLSDNRSDLVKVKQPSLIMQCSDDIIAPTVVGNYLHENLTNSTLTLLNATGHCPHMSAPEETIIEMKRYIASL